MAAGKFDTVEKKVRIVLNCTERIMQMLGLGLYMHLTIMIP